MIGKSFKVLVSGGALFFLVYAHAEDLGREQVPAPVLNAFEKAYPDAKDVEYEREVKNGQTYYEIEFDDKQGKDNEVMYNESGGVVSTEID